MMCARSHSWWLDTGVMETQFTFRTLLLLLLLFATKKQKEQFKMIMKRLLSYGDGKCGVWRTLTRKSPDVTRGM